MLDHFSALIYSEVHRDANQSSHDWKEIRCAGVAIKPMTLILHPNMQELHVEIPNKDGLEFRL